ncbi:MAG: ribosomal protein L22 [Patescibacteria group bacterium]|jgi:ribosomal protein L22
MAEEIKNKPQEKVETKVEAKAQKAQAKPVEAVKEEKKVQAKPVEAVKEAQKAQAKPVEAVKEEKKVQKPAKTEKPSVRDKAIINAFSSRVSLKHAKFICKMIKGKTPEQAEVFCQNVVKGKQPVKMTGLEVPHQKGEGIAGARYPKNAAIAIGALMKSLKANALVAGIEDPVITVGMPNTATRPMKRGGKKAKRAHLHFEVRSKAKLIEESKK